MKIQYHVCAGGCNQNVRRTYEGMCKACWIRDNPGQKLPRFDRARCEASTRKRRRRWRKTPESERLKQQARHAERLEVRARLQEKYAVEDAVTRNDVLLATNPDRTDDLGDLKRVKRVRYVKNWRREQREALLPSDRLCSCGRVRLKSREWVVIPAYETKEARARARIRELETGEEMKQDWVGCVTCYRKAKKCGSLQEAVS